MIRLAELVAGRCRERQGCRCREPSGTAGSQTRPIAPANLAALRRAVAPTSPPRLGGPTNSICCWYTRIAFCTFIEAHHDSTLAPSSVILAPTTFPRAYAL